MTTPNTELAYKVLDHIDVHPESWNQLQWWCGTAGCFAGWAVKLSGGQMENVSAEDSDSGYRETFVLSGLSDELNGRLVSWVAAKLLGIDWRADGFDGPDEIQVFEAAISREELGEMVEEIFGPRPAVTE